MHKIIKKIIIVLSIFLLFVVLFLGKEIYRGENTTFKEVIFTVEKGDGAKIVANNLKKEEFRRSYR